MSQLWALEAIFYMLVFAIGNLWLWVLVLLSWLPVLVQLKFVLSAYYTPIFLFQACLECLIFKLGVIGPGTTSSYAHGFAIPQAYWACPFVLYPCRLKRRQKSEILNIIISKIQITAERTDIHCCHMIFAQPTGNNFHIKTCCISPCCYVLSPSYRYCA